ncbi:SDR family NAD(P)-dependent oxidoreductase [Microbacterium rhizosphaerae]|uniref:SDR family oxidoreductase n=1 Tax=Microbacterium rhizosphaerae TaxID=1678237 RepID=A0ABZ0SL39_9MICO|nr:SDR family oxidoreductase [Microbacterium rhizosphaerae]WPR89338.1 SDR family oxidoreductase [Microbacterium rhizosphaerae]
MNAWDGKVAIVTGGASGIGRATVERLARDGAQVAIFDRSVVEGVDAVSVVVDVTDPRSVERAVADVVARWGRIDIVVNSAGVGAAGRIVDNDDAEWTHVLDVNLMGAVRVIRAAIPHLIAARPSCVVNVVSAVALTGFPNRSLYSASKGALLALTRALAADHLADGVRFNAVCPGTTETPWIQRLLEAAPDAGVERSKLEARQPHGRLVTAEEVAAAVAYLAGPDAQSTNGVALSVDAGIEALYVGS